MSALQRSETINDITETYVYFYNKRQISIPILVRREAKRISQACRNHPKGENRCITMIKSRSMRWDGNTARMRRDIDRKIRLKNV
jgi:hypothetical protein